MKIFIDNQDRTEEIKARIESARRAGGDLPRPEEFPPATPSLALRLARSESEYQDILIRLIRSHDQLDTGDFPIPRRRGRRGRYGAWLKKKLWKLLRYQHDRIAYRQNLVNSMLSGALEYERDRHRAEIARLEARIRELERGGGR